MSLDQNEITLYQTGTPKAATAKFLASHYKRMPRERRRGDLELFLKLCPVQISHVLSLNGQNVPVLSSNSRRLALWPELVWLTAAELEGFQLQNDLSSLE